MLGEIVPARGESRRADVWRRHSCDADVVPEIKSLLQLPTTECPAHIAQSNCFGFARLRVDR